MNGNKRAGLLALLIFFEIDGHRLAIADREATLDTVGTIEAVASGAISEEALTVWIAERSQSIT